MALATQEKPQAPPSAFGGGGFGDAMEQVDARLREEQAAREAEAASRSSDPYHGMTAKEKRAAKKAARTLKGKFSDYPVLDALRPKERYRFKSDYFHMDGEVATVLAFFHDEGANDDFGAFWGVNRIPNGLGEDITVVVVEQVRRMGESWIEDKLKTVENLDRMEEQEQSETGTMRSKRKSAKVSQDMQIVAQELADGASYLHVHDRLLVKAPTLERLDEAIDRIDRLFIDRFATLKTAPYHAEQRGELGSLFLKNSKKRGKGFHFTSVELAGSHHLVTNGLNDPTGEYVGYMTGDVNTSAVLFDVDHWEKRVMVADSSVNSTLGRARVPDMWGSKISQSALIAGRRVVHIVLDGADLDKLGPRLDGITSRMDLTRGDMNMFEIFGEQEEELTLFPQHMEKIKLMVEEAGNITEAQKGAVRGRLNELVEMFYVDQRMWAKNAKENRDRLRIVGIPHDQVPLLKMFVTYLDTAYKSELSSGDKLRQEAVGTLVDVMRAMLDTNGDLFNVPTSSAIDGVRDARRMVYDFSELLRRGRGIAMAQLVNVIGFSVSKLGLGDVVIIHGADSIRSEGVKSYMDEQFEHLFARGGRVAYLYNDPDKAIDDVAFNAFDDADWTIFGPMRDSTVKKYQKTLHQVIPPDLERLVTTKGEGLGYLRRGQTNVVFRIDLALGVNPARQKNGVIGAGRRPSRQAGKASSGAAAAPSPTGTSTAERVELDAVSESKQAARDARTSTAKRTGGNDRAGARKSLKASGGDAGKELR